MRTSISRFSSNSMVNLMLIRLLLQKYRNMEAVPLLSNKEKVSSTYLNQIDGRDSLRVIASKNQRNHGHGRKIDFPPTLPV